MACAKFGVRQWFSLLICILSFLPHLTTAQSPFYAATDEAYAAAKSDDDILVSKKENRYWGFFSQDASLRRDVGFIYHTGPFFDERAYAPIVRALASQGYPTFIIDEPLSLAWLTPFRADLVIRDYPEIKGWVVGGHGVGGCVASCYAQWRGVDGLALFSAAPYSLPFPLSVFNKLAYKDMDVISLWGTLDGITSREEWESGKDVLPEDALFEEIEGGNFSLMAWLKETVSGDNEATISRRSQQAIIIDRLFTLLFDIQNKIATPSTEDKNSDGDDKDDSSKSSDNSGHRLLRFQSI